MISLPIVPAPLVVSFCGSDGTRAQLAVNKGRVTFEGDPDSAADIFIEAVTRKHAQQWAAQQTQLEETEARLAAYSHHSHNGWWMQGRNATHCVSKLTSCSVARNVHYS